jgi:hypothetical protein
MLAYGLLRDLADLPELSLCGVMMFDTVVVRHDGIRWIAECEAVERVD